jgi:hypothetical protein
MQSPFIPQKPIHTIILIPDFDVYVMLSKMTGVRVEVNCVIALLC